MDRTPHWFARPLALATLGLALMLGPGNGPARADDDAVLPDSSQHYGWFQRQRIRFFNGRLLTQAQSAIDRGDVPTAEALLLDALGNDPGNNHAKRMLIDVYDKSGAWDNGIALCDDLLATYPDYVDGYLKKAFLATKKHDTSQAIPAFKEVISRTEGDDPRHTEALQNLAPLYFQTGNYAFAAQLAEAQLHMEETYDVRMLLAECAIAQTNLTGALSHLDAALKLARTSEQRGEIERKRGYLYYDLGDFANASAALQTASQLLPGEVDRLQVARQLGETAMRQGAYNQAAEFFGTFLHERFDDHVAAAYVEALAAAGASEKATAEAEAFLRRDNVTSSLRKQLLSQLVYLYKKLGNAPAGYQAALSLYELEPTDHALLEMAYAAEKLDDKSKAIGHYKAYLDKQFRPDVALSYYYLLKNAGRPEDGEPVLTRLLGLDGLDETTRTDALYELAQLRRETGRIDEYFDIMKQVTARSGDLRFYLEYADQLFGAGRYEEAVAQYKDLLEQQPDPATRFRICRTIANVNLAIGRPAESRDWLEKALTYGLPDISWHLIMARVDYQLGNFDACVDRLLALDEKSDVVNLYLGFAFYQMKMPGLAFYHLRLVEALDKLPPNQRYNLFANLAYLAYDQGLYDETLDHVEQALSLRISEDMSLIHIKALAALGQYGKARDMALAFIATRDTALKESLSAITRRHPDSDLKFALLNVLTEPGADVRSFLMRTLHREEDSELKMDLMILLADKRTRIFAELFELAGLCALRLDRHDEAIALLSSCMELDPLRVEAYFLRGLAQFKRGRFEEAETDFAAYKHSANAVSHQFWANFGVVEGRLGKYREGTEALGETLALYPSDIDAMEESGYQFMKWPSNDNAAASFANAIDTYSDILPYLEGEDRATYQRNRTALKREYSKLDRRLGGQVYFSKTDYDIPGTIASSSINGALPSQLGAEINGRPPTLGFRDEKTFDVFGRILGNFENDSWQIDQDSYQGGVGLRYKPLRSRNAVTSIERLFPIGDNAEDNWLWRILASQEWGEKPSGARPFLLTGKIYGDVGYFLEDKRRWYYYLDGRAGLTWNLNNKTLVTLPQLLGVVRYESNDDSDLLSYSLAGIGLSGRLFEPERRYVTERWYVDVYAHYVWGWFRDQPADLDSTSFDGVVFGLNFIK